MFHPTSRLLALFGGALLVVGGLQTTAQASVGCGRWYRPRVLPVPVVQPVVIPRPVFDGSLIRTAADVASRFLPPWYRPCGWQRPCPPYPYPPYPPAPPYPPSPYYPPYGVAHAR